MKPSRPVKSFSRLHFLSPTSAWHLQSAKDTTLHLNQQIQPFLKWLWGRKKSPANRINTLTSVNLSDTNLQTCQELLSAPFLSTMSTWHLQLARASTLHLDQLVQLLLKWLRGRTKAPVNRINALTSVNLVDTTLQEYQELLNSPFLSPMSA